MPAFALSEPEAGSDAASIAATATPSGSGFVVNGRKTWISNSGLADLYVVFARTPGEEGAQGLSAFLVDGGNAGVTLEERLRVLPPHRLNAPFRPSGGGKKNSHDHIYYHTFVLPILHNSDIFS